MYLAKGGPCRKWILQMRKEFPLYQRTTRDKRAEMGLNDSFILQYLEMVRKHPPGKFLGSAIAIGAPVWGSIGLLFYFPNTIYLGSTSCWQPPPYPFLSLLYAAYHIGSRLDRLIRRSAYF